MEALEMQIRHKLGTLSLEIALTGNYKYFHQKSARKIFKKLRLIVNGRHRWMTLYGYSGDTDTNTDIKLPQVGCVY